MHFTKYFLLLLYIRTFAYCFCPPQSTSLSLTDVYRVWQRQKRNIEEKREAATKKQFSLLLSSVFSWSADSEQALLGPYDSDAFVHCARADRGRQHGRGGSEVNGLQEERSVCGGIINNILSAFCVKFADFFSLSLWPCLLFFACCFCSPTLNAGLQQFSGLVSTTPDRVLLIFEAHFWAQYASYIRAKSCG